MAKSTIARTKTSRVMRRPKFHERGVRFSCHDWMEVRMNRRARPGYQLNDLRNRELGMGTRNKHGV